ncbi:hypothetical protein Tcan_00771, partial [Toxocara canis]
MLELHQLVDTLLLHSQRGQTGRGNGKAGGNEMGHNCDDFSALINTRLQVHRINQKMLLFHYSSKIKGVIQDDWRTKGEVVVSCLWWWCDIEVSWFSKPLLIIYGAITGKFERNETVSNRNTTVKHHMQIVKRFKAAWWVCSKPSLKNCSDTTAYCLPIICKRLKKKKS